MVEKVPYKGDIFKRLMSNGNLTSQPYCPVSLTKDGSGLLSFQ